MASDRFPPAAARPASSAPRSIPPAPRTPAPPPEAAPDIPIEAVEGRATGVRDLRNDPHRAELIRKLAQEKAEARKKQREQNG